MSPDLGTQTPLPGAPLLTTFSLVLVGRQQECERIDGLLAGAGLGRSGVLVLSGDAGIGKSALLDYAIQRADGFDVLHAAGIESEADLPFAGLHALLRPLADLIDRIPEPQARALRVALALETGEPNLLSAHAGTLSVLAEAAERAPVLVAVDDAHWLDRASLGALAFALRRLAAEPIAALVATRPPERPGSPLERLPTLELAGVEQVAALALLRGRWGGELAPEVSRRLAEAAGGNPLALVEVPVLLTDRERRGLDPLEDPLPVAESIARGVRRALRDLPEQTRRELLLLAARGSDTRLELAALAPAEEAGLIRLHAAAATFRHPLMRSAVYLAATSDERRGAHRVLADAFADDPDRHAWHMAATAEGPDEELAFALEEAARRGAARGGHAAESRALERAARLSPDDDRRAGRLSAASRAAYWAGEPERALSLVEEALPLVNDPLIRADAVHQRFAIAGWQGLLQSSHKELEAEAERVASLDAERAAKLLGVVVASCLDNLDARGALQVARRRVELCESAGEEWRHRTLKDLIWALVMLGETREAVARLPEVLADPDRASGAAPCLVWLERYEEARSTIEPSLASYRSAGNLLGTAYELTNLALLEIRLARLGAATLAASEGAQLAEEMGNLYLLGCNLPMLARIAAIYGNEAACRADAERSFELAARIDAASIRADASLALGLLELGLGRPREAAAALEPLAGLVEERGLREPSVVPYGPDLIEAHIRAGDTAAARTMLSDFEAKAEALGRQWALAGAARCAGLLAEPGEIDVHFERSLRRHERSENSFERARTELCYGERLRRASRRIDAREQLRSAIARFDLLGAAPWSGRARSELLASGESIPRRDPTAPERLTPQELQIASQVAAGKTNREVGAALFLSPKTVEHHLTAVYRKLELHSRGELTRLFASEGRDQALPAPARVASGR